MLFLAAYDQGVVSFVKDSRAAFVPFGRNDGVPERLAKSIQALVARTGWRLRAGVIPLLRPNDQSFAIRVDLNLAIAAA